MDRFSTELEYYPYVLFDARSMVLTSFFSQKSISPLDLQIGDYLHPRRRTPEFFLLLPIIFQSGEFFSQLELPNFKEEKSFKEKTFFCSEESFRNSLLPKRRLLYTLNLDFPYGREYNHLKNGFAPINLPLNRQSLFVTIMRYKGLFEKLLAYLIGQALEKNDNKLKLLKWMADFRPLESVFLPLQNQESIGKILYCECKDTELLLKCFGKLFGIDALLVRKKSDELEHLLYNARLSDFDVRSKMPCVSSFSDYCIRHLNFHSVPSILKYEHTVYYTDESYEEYKEKTSDHIRWENRKEEMSRSEGQMSKLRLYRILQIIYIFQHRNIDIGFEYFAPVAIRLLWRSIPDCYVSLQEMSDAYQHVFTDEFLSEAHRFYQKKIGQTVSCPEPRRLSHYCRSVVRKSLHDAKRWLPDGIQQLNLPPRVESFLNLQTHDLRPRSDPPETDLTVKEHTLPIIRTSLQTIGRSVSIPQLIEHATDFSLQTSNCFKECYSSD